MKSSDRSILIGLVLLGLLAAFWFLMLSPKRETAAELETQANDLRTQVQAQEQLAAAAEQAEAEYDKNYERLIVLGKAAPADGDTPSLLAQLTAQAEASRTTFGSLTTEGAEAGEVPAAAQTTTDQNQAAGPPVPATTPAVPTEASAATLPLGATVGPAGLGVLPYTLQFSGDFFEIADLLQSIDGKVEAGKSGADVEGRLITVNGFTLAPMDEEAPGDELTAELSITTYVLPDSQGLTAGATPGAPPATVPPANPTPTSTTPAP